MTLQKKRWLVIATKTKTCPKHLGVFHIGQTGKIELIETGMNKFIISK